MMRGLSGGAPRGDASQRARQYERDKAKDLLDQRIARLERRAVGTSGILGAARIASTAGSIVQTAGGGRIDEGSVTYGAPVDPYAGTPAEGASPISSWLTVVNGYQIQLAQGWYSLTVNVDAAWATAANAPDNFIATILGLPDAHAESNVYQGITRGTRKGMRQNVSAEVPVYGGSEYGLVWVEVELGSHAGTSDSLVGLTGSVSASHTWTIVKHT